MTFLWVCLLPGSRQRPALGLATRPGHKQCGLLPAKLAGWTGWTGQLLILSRTNYESANCSRAAATLLMRNSRVGEPFDAFLSHKHNSGHIYRYTHKGTFPQMIYMASYPLIKKENIKIVAQSLPWKSFSLSFNCHSSFLIALFAFAAL